jgi:membrane protein
MYGSAGSIIQMLLYFYISTSVLLFGAEVNAAIERHALSGTPSQDRKRH